MTFQDIDFFFFFSPTSLLLQQKGEKGFSYTEDATQEMESWTYTSRALKLKSALFGLTRRVVKQGNKFTEGDISPQLAAGRRGGFCLPTGCGAGCKNHPQLTLRGRSDSSLVGVPSGPKIYESIEALRLKKQQLLLGST